MSLKSEGLSSSDHLKKVTSTVEDFITANPPLEDFIIRHRVLAGALTVLALAGVATTTIIVLLGSSGGPR